MTGTAIAELISAGGSSLSTLLIAYIGFKSKSGFKTLNRKLADSIQANKREHLSITESIDQVNARESLTKALTKVCNSSISYTSGEHDLNTFKTTFTNAVISLSTSTLNNGFDIISKDSFHGYMDIASSKIKHGYKDLPIEFIKFTRVHIQEASSIYYDGVSDIIIDNVFNDKYDRFVDLTISFLRTELMLITKHWWKYTAHE